MVSNTIKNVDVFAFTQENEDAYVNYLKVVEGAVIQTFTLEIEDHVSMKRKNSFLGLQ